jgi:hypothetical protein
MQTQWSGRLSRLLGDARSVIVATVCAVHAALDMLLCRSAQSTLAVPERGHSGSILPMPSQSSEAAVRVAVACRALGVKYQYHSCTTIASKSTQRRSCTQARAVHGAPGPDMHAGKALNISCRSQRLALHAVQRLPTDSLTQTSSCLSLRSAPRVRV